MSREQRSLTSDLLRELIHTPAARELASTLLISPGAEEAAAETTRTLLWEDLELTLAALARVPEWAGAGARSLDELGRALEQIPPPLAVEVAAQLLERLDQEALKTLAATWVRVGARLWADPASRRALTRSLATLLERLAESDPKALLRPAAQLALELMQHIDFGQLRAAVDRSARAAREELPLIIQHAVGDPVLLANLVQTLPPLVNTTLALSAEAIEALRLPREVLASGLFNLLESLDPAVLARIVDGVSRLLVQAHAGNLVLGQHEPALRSLLRRLLLDLAGRIDSQQASRAVAALAEDLATLLRAGSDLLYSEPALLPLTLATGSFALQTTVQGLTAALEKLGQLPPEALEQSAGELEQGLHHTAVTSTELINASTRLLGQILEHRPRLTRRAIRALWRGVDRPGLGRLLAGLGQPLLEELDTPEGHVELEQTLRQAGAGLLARPALMQTLTRPLWEAAEHLALQYVRTLPGRLLPKRRRKGTSP
jgi:hypothetical protein